MIFGNMPVSQALGAILAHSLALPDGRLRKGRVLTADDLRRLEHGGVSEVVAARLEPGDVGEDLAATRLARALVPDPKAAGVRLGKAATGRVNIYANAPGVIDIEAGKIHAVNAVHPAITVATVPPWQRCAAAGMVATVKIITYGVPGADLERVCQLGAAAMTLHPVVCRTALLIETVVGDQNTGDKGYEVTKGRLGRMGVTLAPRKTVPHRAPDLAHALAESRADIVLILTGSATSDPQDVAPEAVRRAGGKVTHYGMPVDPGNLLFLGKLGTRPVIGLPGCARSPALNGADWVLERLLCGVPVTSADIAGMGVGGLLKEIPLRGRLREA